MAARVTQVVVECLKALPIVTAYAPLPPAGTLGAGGALGAGSIVDDSSAVYAEVGTWTGVTTTGIGYLNSYRYAALGDGTTTATWTVTGLASATYDIQVTWVALAGNATDAHYDIYDGNTFLKAVRHDQTAAPGGKVIGKITFRDLGQFTITSGTCKVVLKNDTAIGNVVADAIWVAASTPSPLVLDNLQPGYAEVGTWSGAGGLTGGGGYNGEYRFAAAGDGTTTATWTATGLASGTYNIQTTWSTNANRATNAKYRIYDNATLVKEIRINQQIAPGGSSYGGAVFQDLGQYTITSGTCNVVLYNDANGFVIADAVTINPVSSPPTIIDDQQPGYAEVGTWTGGGGDGTGYNGEYRFAAAGDGTTTATWSATVTPGYFNFSASWSVNANRGTNVKYRVYDNTTLLHEVRVDQTTAAVGPSYCGSTFYDLGTFLIASGTAKVVLYNDANGYVIADAVRIQSVQSFNFATTAVAPVKTGTNGATTVTFAGLASEHRNAKTAASTLIAFSPAGTQIRNALVPASTAINFNGTAAKIRVALAAAATTVTLAYSASQVRVLHPSASSAIAMAPVGGAVRAIILSGSSAFNLADVSAAARDAHGSGAVTLGFADAGSQVRAVAGSSATTISFAAPAASVRDLLRPAATTINLAPVASQVRLALATATTTANLADAGSSVRDILISAATMLVVAEGTTGFGGQGNVAFTPLGLADQAAAVREMPRSAGSAIGLTTAGSEVRSTSSDATSTIVWASLGAAPRERSSSAVSAVAFASAGGSVRDVFPASSTALGIVGTQGAASKDAALAASTTVLLAGTSGSVRDLFPMATTTLAMVVGIAGVRDLVRSASTNIKLRGDGAGLNRALGGSIVASQESGYQGQYQQGQVVVLSLATTSYQGRPAIPDSAPTADIYDDQSVLVASFRLPMIDRGGQVGLFSLPLYLGGVFDSGSYRVLFRYQIGTYSGAKLDRFDVLPGGDPGGAVISMFSYDRPEARYVVAQLSGGTLIQGRNPRI